jgi:LPPG:FO 2-phospho-L-lactate transferase
VTEDARTYVALSGGVGGAKLSLGLANLLGDRLSVIANTGDDFEHLGLHISPDVDTALYTLAGIVNPDTGWGRRDETWTFMEAIAKLGGENWFRLGDGDLAMHVDRTRRLKAGETLTAFCAHAAERLGITAHILPMTDDPLRTIVDTDAGTLAFQEYFVREQCRPAVRSIRFEGGADASPTREVLAALSAPTLAGIIICPSNPWLSVDPILAVPGLRPALKASGTPIIAVSPIIAGKALKGPAAKIMAELGLAVTGASVARHYAGLIDGFVVDTADAALVPDLLVPSLVTNTVMRTLDDRVALARDCLDFCARLADNTGTVRKAQSASATP